MIRLPGAQLRSRMRVRPRQMETVEHPTLPPHLAKPSSPLLPSLGSALGGQRDLGLLLPGRHIEARSFYTYSLRTLTGITRGSYKLNVTASPNNDTDRVSHPLRADRSDPSPCRANRGWAGAGLENPSGGALGG